MKEELIKVGISLGDMNGIGLEVILKTFEDNRLFELCTPIIFASNKTISYQKKFFNIDSNFQGINSPENAVPGKFNVVNCWKESPSTTFGEVTKEGGKYAYISLKEAVQALKNETIDVLVTAPINKNNIQSDDFNFPGHTDYLAKELNGKSLMFLVSDEVKVGLLTDHVPISEVSEKIDEALITEKVTLIHESLQKDFRLQRPRIAVLGLNPHCGDNGVIGKEDDEIIRPTLKKIYDSGILVFGPFSGDGFFASGNYKKYDAVIAPYHDQGLIPFKTLTFGSGVNFTAGLNRIRTSPDHGTAYEIAGKNEANPESFKQAVYQAIDIFKNRSEYEELNRNKMKINEIQK